MTALLAVTPGEPAGIGPDLCLQYFTQQGAESDSLIIIADPDLISRRAQQLGLSIPSS